MWNDLKYLIAYASPLSACLGIWCGGVWSPGAVYLGFVIIPLLELVLPKSKANLTESEEKERSARKFFDVLLYFHVLLLYGLVCLFVWRVGYTSLAWWEIYGMTASLGVIFGTNGINVAHELGHRPGWMNTWASRMLLVPSFYTHFTIEHNYGHHRNVGTPEDPATARRGETVYEFWWRSTIGSLINAWVLERSRLKEKGAAFWGPANALLVGVVLQLAYLAGVLWLGGPLVMGALVAAGIMGFLLLETVNYIEHYGLTRATLPSGHYAPVEAFHSWNSNHELGRIFLYELVRHPDHHYRANRKYQILRHLNGAPQLPTGYPGSMLLSLVPPLWRRAVHRQLARHHF